MSLKSVKLVTTSQEAETEYDTFFISATGGSITLTLPEISNNGENFYIKRIDNSILNTVTVRGYDSSQTINGNISVLLLPSNSLTVIAYNNVWN